MDRLPVYRLDRPNVSQDSLVRAARDVFGLEGAFRLAEAPGRLTLRSGDLSVEQHTASGGIWAADEGRWFNPALRPDLPSGEKAASIALELGRSNGLLPELPDGFRFAEPTLAGTRLAILESRQRTDIDLDVQVVFGVQVGDLPVVGGGGDFSFAFGDGGRLIGYSGVWRPTTEAFDAGLLPQDQIHETYQGLFADAKGMKLESVTSYLAYHSAPAFAEQEFLYPVYVVLGTAVVGDAVVPVRAITVAATDFGPRLELPPIAPARPTRARPGSKPMPEKRKRRGYADTAAVTAARPTAGPTKPWEAGASWIGMSGGLSGSASNAQGFIDEWAADGWIIDFNWGDWAAFESDWRRNDDTWVDNADFVFYTGHANRDGWVLSKPDDTFLSFAEVGNSPEAPGDLWGSSDLEWVCIAACGPLQDELLAKGGGDVLARWDGAFDGLHQLMGYGAITFDNTEEGRRLASYCRSGMTVKDAWFRTAKEIQPATNGASAPDGPNVWVGTMWVGKAGVDPIGDHAWSHGSVSADPTAPTFLACMWTIC